MQRRSSPGIEFVASGVNRIAPRQTRAPSLRIGTLRNKIAGEK
jgi:hypothetical protein